MGTQPGNTQPSRSALKSFRDGRDSKVRCVSHVLVTLGRKLSGRDGRLVGMFTCTYASRRQSAHLMNVLIGSLSLSLSLSLSRSFSPPMYILFVTCYVSVSEK